MNSEGHQKVTTSHLKRDAYLYVRQSTVRQVIENTESTQRQYALRQRAVALGWPHDRVIVIDSDLGQSGASAVDREGFQKLVAEVGMGRAGIVLGLEVSRLARNSTDWHRLLEICALTDTLILDEDGIYDPAHFNDRLLLGLKGTMSEAELHVLRARLRGGIINKARRGELRCRLPVGFVYDGGGHVVLDPDKQVQESVRLLFATFARTGAAHATLKYFRQERLLFPTRIGAGASKGELAWTPLSLGRTASILHNPWYAGAYAFGRCRWRKRPDGGQGSRRENLPRAEWLDRLTVGQEERQRILALATDFPAVWRDPTTPQRERKRMLALLIEDITLLKQRELTVAIRFRGGATTTLTLPRPLTPQQLRATDPEVRRQIDALLDEYTDVQVAHVLNQRELRTGTGDAFDGVSVQWVRFSAKLKSLKKRLLDAGWLTSKQVARQLGVSRTTVSGMRVARQLKARICSDRGEWLYWAPDSSQTPSLNRDATSTARGAV